MCETAARWLRGRRRDSRGWPPQASAPLPYSDTSSPDTLQPAPASTQLSPEHRVGNTRPIRSSLPGHVTEEGRSGGGWGERHVGVWLTREVVVREIGPLHSICDEEEEEEKEESTGSGPHVQEVLRSIVPYMILSVMLP